MTELIPDIRYAVRTFRQTPTVTIVIVLSLALGIGANTAMYSAVDAMFLRELAVRNPGELVVFGWQSGPAPTPFVPLRGGVSATLNSGGRTGITRRLGSKFPFAVVEKFRTDGHTLSAVAAFTNVDVDATIEGAGDEITAQLVSGNYFETIGVSTTAGRTIGTDDDRADAPPAVVISHGFWHRRFAKDPSTIGKPILLSGVLPATIVGVTPAEFHIGGGTVPDLFIPLAFESVLASGLLAPENWGVNIVARCKPGTTLEQIEGNLQGILSGRALEEAPNTVTGDLPRLAVRSGAQSFSVDLFSDSRLESVLGANLLVIVLAGAFAVLLIIVGLNVANLLIARAARRQYEIGVRLSMGASRRRLIRQLLTESAMLASIGGTLGILLAYSGKGLLRFFLQQDVRTVLDLRIDLGVLAFSAVVSLLTGILFGIAPALRATRMNVSTAVKQGSRSVRGGHAGVGRALLVIQVAMSVILLVGASLLLRTVGNLPSTDIGFNAEHLLVLRVNTGALNDDRVRYNQVREALAGLPGVLGVTASSAAFLSRSGSFTNGRFYPPGDDSNLVRADTIRMHTVDPNFFDMLKIPILRGRSFGQTDATGAPRVAIVTESIARRFPGDPIGWRLEMGDESEPKYAEIIGVVKNVGLSELGRALDGTVFLAGSQAEGMLPVFDVRTAGSPMLVIPAIREALRQIDPNLRASQVSTEMEQARQKLAQTRYIAVAWIGFGGIALLLTAIGLYGLLSHSVSRRVNEIGVRMALGARQFHVLRLVMSQIFILVIVGLAAGLGLSIVIHMALQPFVYGVKLYEPTTLVAAAAIMLAVAAVTGYLPARRATLVDPTVALRHE